MDFRENRLLENSLIIITLDYGQYSIINDTRLPKNCLPRIWYKLTVKNEQLF